MENESEGVTIDAEENAVPFTARLIAHYRAQESKRENPLIIDPYAERLAGDLQFYAKDHKRTAGSGDYAIVRAHYVENRLRESWDEYLQIVILGAGLDTRAYRFSPLKGDNTIIEIDY
ncbi:MAG: class I SAM-dependent methyltransferase, partial [Candidatus Thorarchaeota archaeon]|nr:class I SAM-dependent methyltransferase [Candidatus Thorarchaeota archaeon]